MYKHIFTNYEINSLINRLHKAREMIVYSEQKGFSQARENWTNEEKKLRARLNCAISQLDDFINKNPGNVRVVSKLRSYQDFIKANL